MDLNLIVNKINNNYMKKAVWSVINFTRGLFFRERNKVLYVVDGSSDSEQKVTEVVRRLKYFEPNLNIAPIVDKISGVEYLNFDSVVFLSTREVSKVLKLKKNDVFNLDYTSNYLDGWDFHYFLTKLHIGVYNNGVNKGRETLIKLKADLSNKFSKSYIFGTGPSLEKAINYDFNDGIRIVSNTIVKDEELWLHLNPHFIVAGDAIYHFGIGQFAQKFRKDLKLRLKQTDTHFVYPAHFHPFCVKEFKEFEDRLIPVPIGSNSIIHNDLTLDYTLPIHGNVLLLLLLPLACTLSNDVNLWGFDGRSPNDKLFWKNSSKQFYTEDVDELMQLHPLFFDKLVPKNAPDSYVKKVHGDVLDNGLSQAEKDGFTFGMLHHSYTETLAKRHKII